MHRAWLMAALVLSAGCLGFETDGDDTGDGPAPDDGGASSPPEPVPVTRTFTFDAELAAGVANGRLDVEWLLPTVQLIGGSFRFTWDAPVDRLGIEVESPDGAVTPHAAPAEPTATAIEAALPALVAGTYAFYPTGMGPVVPADLQLAVTLTFYDLGGATTPGDPPVAHEGVTVERSGDRWIARTSVAGTTTAGPAMQLEIGVANGEVDVQAEGDDAGVELVAWARGATADEARERLATIRLTLLVRPDRLVGKAEAPEWHERGVDASVHVPPTTTTGGAIGTSNGDVTLDGLKVQGLTIGTSNGGVAGSIETTGDLTIGTSNGEVELTMQPTTASSFTIGTSNGGVELTLAEGPQIAYTVTASTSNGSISEDMREARLQGSGTAATLRTDGGTGRPVQVSGTIGTSNASIAFHGA